MAGDPKDDKLILKKPSPNDYFLCSGCSNGRNQR